MPTAQITYFSIRWTLLASQEDILNSGSAEL